MNRFAQPDETQINLPLFEGTQLVATGHIKEIDRDSRERTSERCERDRKKIVEQIRDVTQVEGRRFCSAEVLNVLDHLCAEREDPFCIGQERTAFGRQRHAGLRAIDQPDFDFGFQILYLAGQRRLSQMQLFPRPS